MTRRHRRRKSWIAYGAGAVALATAATYGTIALASPSSGGSGDGKAGPGQTALQADFADAAHEFQVPQSVLMAVSYRQTLWESHQGTPSTTGNYNVMGLTQVTDADLEQPSTADLLDHTDLSGDPAVSRHFDADRALKSAGRAKVDTSDPRLHTLEAAAKLIGASTTEVRTDPRQSVRAGAALLAQYEKAAVGSLPADPGRWWAGVARYSQSPDRDGAEQFVQRVFDTVKAGATRVTADGQALTLAADPSVRPVEPSKVPLAAGTTVAPAATAATTPECPASLNCNFVAAAYKQNSSTSDDFGNYNVSGRPGNGEDIRYIVIHDMEGTFDGSIKEFQDSTAYASAHYLIADDGRVTQMVQLKDEAWHAANKTVNMHSVGVEHEGWAIKTGDWFTEQEYDSSAVLVKYLAQKFGIPLDREHVIGHDEVPGVLDANVKSQHWDPGPYWDWNHYMSLLGAPDGAGGAGGPLKTGQLVRVVPPYTTANEPKLTNGGAAVPAHPANFVYLYTSPATTASLPADPYLGTPVWSDGANWADKVRAGGEYVVADTQTDWTAIWYQGRELWFHNPGGQYTSVVAPTSVLTPAAGRTSIPVYGRAYPEDAAYAGTNVPVQDQNSASLTKYSIAAGQVYAQAGPEAVGDYWYAGSFAGTATGDRTLVKGSNQFYPIRYNHRIAWVRASDVQQTTSAAPVPGSTRHNLVARDASGALWQYQGTGNAGSPYYSRFKVGGGWQVYNALTAMDSLRADAVGDMVARDSSGTLYYYKGSGRPAGPFLAKTKVGPGWNVYGKIVGVGDATADGNSDLIARDSSGTLWLYKGTGNGTFAPKSAIGPGWNAYDTLVGAGDLNGDGKADLVARDSSGTLWLYKGTGSATGPYAPKAKIGTGWNTYNTLVGAGDVTGDGTADLVARDTTGTLWLYKGTGSPTGGPYAARTKIGTGWQIYNLLA